MKTLAANILRLALLGTGTAVSATAPTAIPLIQGLTVVSAASERQGDYESTSVIDGVDADGTLHLDASAELPDPAGGKAKPVSFPRYKRRDASTPERINHMFSTGPQEVGHHDQHLRAVINDLRNRGNASIASMVRLACLKIC